MMVGVSFAAVPLYDAFCRVTGYGGTTQRKDVAGVDVLDRVIEIRFDANVSRDLPWRFKPQQASMRLKIGESGLAFYSAENLSGKDITGTASFNVTPQKVGAYFNKIECFCFTEQTLKAGETVHMPVTFFVDPEIENATNLADVKTITLSYTFFETGDDQPDQIAARAVSSETLINED